MGYFWLNQRDDSTRYSDDVGDVYHYRDSVPGCRQLSAGDRFVYYRPQEYEIFGGGIIDEITTEEVSSVDGDGIMTEFYAHIGEFQEFDPPIRILDIKDRVSFLRGRTGRRGVPQNSIYEIDYDDFETIVEAADSERLLEG